MRTISIGIICFVLGLGLGIWSMNLTKPNDVVAASEAGESGQISEELVEATSAAIVVVADSEDPAQPEELVGENVTSDSSPKQVTVSTDLIELLSQREGNRTMGQQLFDAEGVIEQSLQISEQEKVAIQRSWENTKLKIKEFEARSSTVEELEDYSVRITLPDLSQQILSLRDQFSLSVENALGQNRGEVFLAAKQINQLMAKSGGERTYIIAAESPKEGEWRFNMTLESPDGRRVWVGDTIPEEIRHLTDAAQIFPKISELPEEE